MLRICWVKLQQIAMCACVASWMIDSIVWKTLWLFSGKDHTLDLLKKKATKIPFTLGITCSVINYIMVFNKFIYIEQGKKRECKILGKSIFVTLIGSK